MEEFKLRVLGEKEELDAKVGRLAEFIDSSPAYAQLPLAERGRLVYQLHVMRAYSAVLQSRIDAWA